METMKKVSQFLGINNNEKSSNSKKVDFSDIKIV